MTIIFLRTMILYLLVIFAMRIMGKRQIGEFSPSELVVAIMIADLAVIPAQDTDYSLLSGIIPILSLIVMEIGLSFFSMKSQRMRRILSGRPIILVRDGKVMEREMEKIRFHLDDLFEELRTNGYADLSEVDFVMLETSGKMSIIPKADCAPLTRRDMRISAPQERAASIVIADGKVRPRALAALGLDEAWLAKTLKKNNTPSAKDVFLLTVNDDKTVLLQRKEGCG